MALINHAILSVARWELNAVPRSGGIDLPGVLALYRAISTRKDDPQSTEGEHAAVVPQLNGHYACH